MKNVVNTPEFHKIATLGTYYSGFNVQSELFAGKTAQQAADMRHAFSLRIDRQYIVDTIAQADQTVANTFIPEGMLDGQGSEFRANDDAYTYPDAENVGYYDPEKTEANVEEARKLLEGAGYKFDDAGTVSYTHLDVYKRQRAGISAYPYKLIFPALMIGLITLSFNLIGDGLRDAFDPKLRR